jgi:hypothetical protein
MSPKHVHSNRARAGLNRSTFGYLLADVKSFSETFADSVIGAYFRIVGNALRFTKLL